MRLNSDEETVAQQVASLREALLERQGVALASDLTAPNSIDSALEEAMRLARISAHWGIAATVPVVAPLEVFVKRVTRLGLRWYVNPIVEQQNSFNDAAVAALYELRAEIDRLRVDMRRHDNPPVSDQ